MRTLQGHGAFSALLSLTLTLTSVTVAQDLQQLIQAFDESVDSMDSELQSIESSLMSSWGIEDTSTPVGRLFSYTLDKHAFGDGVSGLKVSGMGDVELPGWMAFDPTSLTLEGVPGEEHVGQHYYLQVLPLLEKYVNDSQKADMFSVSVVEDEVHTDSGATPLKQADTNSLQPIKCPAGSSITKATVVVDVDMAEMIPQQHVKMMRSLAEHLGMPPQLLRLLPVGDKPVFDSAALVAGPGDAGEQQHSGALMQWEVGCGNVQGAHMPILQKLESTSQDGSMGEAMGQGVLGWHVTNNKPAAPRRLKRQVWVRPTATLVPSMMPPTVLPIPVGEQLTHTVPVAPSPVTEIQPSKTHKHKHNGKHTKSRKNGRKKTKKPKKPKKTPVPKMTDMISPTVTQVVEPTLPVRPPTEGPSPVLPKVSRSEGVIQPSATPVLPDRPTDPTRPVYTRTQPLPEETDIQPTRTQPTERPTDTGPFPPVTAPSVPDIKEADFAPILNDDIRRLELSVGEILYYKIPAQTFKDREDGNTTQLKLVFTSIDGYTMPRNSWVHFNETSQVLYGLPMAEHVGKHEYIMAAIDKGGRIAKDIFEIFVSRRPREKKINHEFAITLDMDYDDFSFDVNKRIDVASRIARHYGDKDMKSITVTRIARGSVVYAWTNNSVPYEPCPQNMIVALLEYLITDNDTVNPDFLKIMLPYRILRAEAKPYGSCDPNGSSPGGSDIGPGMDADDIEPKPEATSEEDILITTVVPAVVIAAVLLLAGCVACILYRKKRKGKLSDEDQTTFIKKGIPIIFADELDEKPDPPTKPLIMPEEKPACPPPQYSRGGSTMSTPPSDHKEPLIETTDDEDLDMPYRPPPPMTGSLGSRGSRPQHPHQPPYRQPPPYVPP